MKMTFRNAALVAAAALIAVSTQAAPVVIITQIIDGDLTGGTPKCVEITNVGDATADLSTYSVANASNGVGTFGTAFALTGSLVAGDSVVICSEAVTSASVIGAAPDFTSATTNNNGDDVFGLFNNAVLVDVWGQLGVDGTGLFWDTLDSYAFRNSNVTAGNTTFTQSEWTIFPPATLDTLDLAAHQALFAQTVPNTGLGTHSTSSISEWEIYN